MSGLSRACAGSHSFKQENVLGTSFEMMVVADSNTDAAKAWQAALNEIFALEMVLSTWRKDSEISALNSKNEAVVSDSLFQLLRQCERYRVATQNAVSCRIGGLISAWRQAEHRGRVPLETEMRVKAQEIKVASLGLDAKKSRVRRPNNVVFAVDAIAKGWILDRAAKAAIEADRKVAGVMLNIGGDIKIAGDLAEHKPVVGIAGPGAGDNEFPMDKITVAKGGIASSGGGMRDLIIEGRAYSHIISPETGMPQSSVASATVVAPTAAEADVLATAFSVMGVGRSLGYANSHEGVETVIITSGGGRFTSKGWPALMVAVQPQSAAGAGIDNAWPADYLLEIEYELPLISVSNYEAPYVAVWVTGSNNQLVRSLLLLGKEPRWVEENYRYWRRYGRKHPAIVDTLAQPTRKPGRYRLVWDGRDEQGIPVPKGTYTLHVEASREHGAHSYARHDMTLTDGPSEASIPAQAEIGEITLQYGAAE
ncbi:DUF2271 domain-containing protein [Kordiimonas sp.]|uniref:DUF2271 domain-containing protein n=1 Tax=Kordiimonas sp. TaxID=1970157 RepID=UPI003A957988